MSSPLNLNSFVVDKLMFNANPLKKLPPKEDQEINLEAIVKRKANESREFAIELNIKINTSKDIAKSKRYNMEMTIWGFFTFASGTDEETMKRMIRPSGISILYGTARGIIGQLTGVAPYGCFVLPNINVYEKLKNQKRPIRILNKKKE